MFTIWHYKTSMFFPQLSMGVFLDICHSKKWPLVIVLQGFHTGTESCGGGEKAFLQELGTPFRGNCQQGTPATRNQQLCRFQELERFKDF